MDTFDIEKSVGFLMAKAHQRLIAGFRKALTPHGITPPQFALLAFLWKQDGLSQTDLSEKAEVDRTTVGGLVDRLGKSGLVQRLPDPSDRRTNRIHLTERGKELETPLTEIALQVRKKFSAELTEKDYLQLCDLLEKLRG